MSNLIAIAVTDAQDGTSTRPNGFLRHTLRLIGSKDFVVTQAE